VLSASAQLQAVIRILSYALSEHDRESRLVTQEAAFNPKSEKNFARRQVSSKRKVMADKNAKQPENVPGSWYVDTTCSLCRVCLDEAPNLMKYNDDQTYVYFFKEPETPEETAAAQRALDVCPTLSIGNDG